MVWKTCPACASTDTLEIVHGKPTRETEERALRDEVELGGCIIDPADVLPDRRCRSCGVAWSSDPDDGIVFVVTPVDHAAA